MAEPSSTHPTFVAAKEVVKEIVALGIAASNRHFSVSFYGEEVLEQRFKALDAASAQVNSEQDLNTFDLLDAPSIKAMARIGAEHEAGNCQEQSALAFDKLARRGVRPLELMSIQAKDHVLVVAGRVAGTPGACSSWNSDTVICDPWAKRAYFVYALQDEMNLLKKFTNGVTAMVQKFKLDGSESWS